jgi:hypothetical protein
MSLADRIGSLNGEMQRQQIEVLQQYCRDLEKENTYYRNRLKDECTKNEEAQCSLAEDWFFVKKELYNFITFTRAMTPTQAKDSPLLNNVMRFDRKIEEFIASTVDQREYDLKEIPEKGSSPSHSYQSKKILEQVSESSEDVADKTLQEILHLW